ncbi:MAG: methyltransferase domain-containing protein [Alphaproteobacteria bacterium]|nr:methyltransferase domain-containing protein [Alphaproteobacteria bacterium]
MVVSITPDDSNRIDGKLTGLTTSFRLAAMVMARLRKGQIDFVMPDGRTFRFTGPEPGPKAEVIVHDPTFARRVLTGGDIGFAEAFMDAQFDTPSLPDVLEYFTCNFESAGKLAVGERLTQLFNSVKHMLRANSKKGSKRNILAHYDLGNDFYARWLDPSMTYSSAVYERPDLTLEEAQRAKYAAIASYLDLKPGARLLEIGSGWGGFAEYVAKTFNVNVTSVTISDAQHAYAVQRIARAGLADRVDIQLRDYRDITGQFDAVASIEMFEAVGEKYWPQYFGKIGEVLKPGGKAALQIITIEEDQFEAYRRRPDFIQHYIFPGGMLPSEGRLRTETENAGMSFRVARMFGKDYARTLSEWEKRFEEAWPKIKGEAFDERFRRLWLYYLAYCQAGFRVGTIDVGHFVLTR